MSNRIKWVDIYKGLAILLVVVGHTTGQFNPYIYQFHMAAFFFISGYTSRLGEKGLLQTAVAKGYSIYIPYVSFFLLTLAGVWLLNFSGFYPILFKDAYPGVLFSLREFIDHRIHINILGATWFLITLFGIYVVQRLILLLCSDHAGWGYALISTAVFLTGYGIIRATIFIPDGFWYLIFIGQFYFSVGYLAAQNRWFAHAPTGGRNLVLLLALNVLFFYLFAYRWPNTVDYPSRHFGNALFNFLAAANGVLFLFLVSSIFDRTLPAKVVSYAVKIGQNTLGILLLHFLFFKVSYALLGVLGICDISYISSFTPPSDIGRPYWWLISSVSVALSVMTWSIFMRVRFARILMGQDKDTLVRYFTNRGSVIVKLDSMVETRLLQAKRMLVSTVREATRREKKIVMPLIIVMALATWPLLIQGVICNDEVQASYWVQLGWGQLWDHYVTVWASQGRSLGALLNIVAVYIGFSSTNVLLFRAVSVGLMLIVFALFGWLAARLMKRPGIGFATFSALLLLLPISFEHTLPNAFVALFSLPLILAFLSFHLFLSYLESGQKKFLVVSALLWLFFLTGYEAFVILTPTFFVIAYMARRASPREAWRIIVECRHIFATTAVFLVAYIIARKIFPSTYAGNTLASFDLSKSAAVVGQLVASGIPGYYLFNGKYQYLFEIFEGSFQSMGTIIQASPLAVLAAKLFPVESGTLTNFRTAFADPRVLVMSALSLILAWRIGPRVNTGEPAIGRESLPWLVGIPVLMSVMLAIPNSLGELYQGTVNVNNFVALPVTFLIYGFMVFAAVILFWFVLERISGPWSRAMLTGVVALLVLPVQAMNGVFAQEQERNFNRLTMLQAVFETELLRQLNVASVYAPELYETRNLLAINNGYWTNYARSKGLNIEVASKYSGQNYELRVLSDRQVVLLGQQQAVLLSLERIDNRKFHSVQPDTLVSDVTTLGNGVRDGLFFRYTTQMTTASSVVNDGARQAVLSESANQPLVEARISAVGDTYDKAQIQVGFFSDGWVAREASLNIRTGEAGKVALSGLLTIPKRSGMVIEVFDNDRKLGQYKITQEKFQLVVAVNSGREVAHLKFRANWEFDAAPPDVRKLSYLLVSLNGM